jgi:hypothetical protein
MFLTPTLVICLATSSTICFRQRTANMTTTSSRKRRIATGIDFGIRSDSLDLESVSSLLGLNPTSGFEKGEPYVGREKRGPDIVTVDRIRPFGVWHFCTSESLHSNNVEDHAKLLVDALTPAKAAIAQMIADPQFYVRLTIWVLGYTFDLSAACLASLSSFAEEVTITCWEDEEHNSE